MRVACLLVHGPPPQQWMARSSNNILTGEFFNYRTAVIKWLSANFEMHGGQLAWFDRYHDWTQEKRRGD